jgi:hypothetical protein
VQNIEHHHDQIFVFRKGNSQAELLKELSDFSEESTKYENTLRDAIEMIEGMQAVIESQQSALEDIENADDLEEAHRIATDVLGGK